MHKILFFGLLIFLIARISIRTRSRTRALSCTVRNRRFRFRAERGMVRAATFTGEKTAMRRIVFMLVALFGLALYSPSYALESGATCDIEDDAVQQEAMDELERILKALAPAS